MMKISLCFVSLLLSLPVAAFAGGPSIYGTLIDTEDLDESYGIGAKVDLDITQRLAIQVRSAFYDTLGKDITLGRNELQTDLEIVPVEAGLTLRIPIQDRVVPYVGAGLGWYILEADVSVNGRSQEINIDDELGYYFLGGLMLDLGPAFSIFGEYQYRDVNTTLSGDSFSNRVGGDVDVGLSGSSINAGIMLRW
jgi:opacity protein-like surface antigen